ncbi:MAG: dephospho-CoA kinase [Bacteroidales bacterium]|jgi:dephospho-CoA kinase|nr:dephospho-CoA kinase [Bacteroidales bacterium]
MPIKVGITGGIGSGKSTVCKVFKLLGIPVFEADIAAKQLQNVNQKIKKGLISLFGEDIYTYEGIVDRKKLAAIIFNDDLMLSKVNELIHPVVHEEFEKWLKKQNSIYIVHEAAILFESGFYKKMDFNIMVSASEEQRIERIIRRNGISREIIVQRIKKQWNEEKKQKLADFVIHNDNKNLIVPDIIKIDKNLKEYGKIW